MRKTLLQTIYKVSTNAENVSIVILKTCMNTDNIYITINSMYECRNIGVTIKSTYGCKKKHSCYYIKASINV